MWKRALISALSLTKLTASAQQHPHQRRRAQSQEQVSDDDASVAFEYDLSSFSLKFEKCQYVKSFDDDMATSDEYNTVLATKQFVVFQLRPSDQCNNNNKNVVHGEYVAEIGDYLTAAIANRLAAFQTMCDNCNEFCDHYSNDNGAESCSGCGKICFDWESMPNNGYVDASQYTTCAQTDYAQQENNDDNNNVFVGPKCSSDGQSITIGVFADENCWEPISNLDVADVLGYQLSYYLLDQAFVSDDDSGSSAACISCAESDSDSGNNNDQADEDSVNEMCEQLYNKAAKCESIHGLTTGFISMKRENNKDENGEVDNQVENEFMSCTFIQSLIWNSYTETGEINHLAEQDEVIRQVTNVQAAALVCLSIFFVAMVGYGVHVHFAIEELFAAVTLSPYIDGTSTLT